MSKGYTERLRYTRKLLEKEKEEFRRKGIRIELHIAMLGTIFEEKVFPILIQKIKDNLRREGRILLAEAKANAPVKTGNLRDNIEFNTTPLGAEIHCDITYAGYQEFGTVYIRPKHFMTTAWLRFLERIQYSEWTILMDEINKFRSFAGTWKG